MMTSSIRLSSNRSYVRTNQNACITELIIQSKIYHDYKTGQKFKKKKKTEERRAGQNSRNSYRQIVMDDMEYS